MGSENIRATGSSIVDIKPKRFRGLKLHLSPDLYDLIFRAARNRNITQARIVTEILEKYFYGDIGKT
jgi:hypothetical protein